MVIGTSVYIIPIGENGRVVRSFNDVLNIPIIVVRGDCDGVEHLCRTGEIRIRPY
jgi:hypothetical protein